MIMKLLLMEKGEIQSSPNMGIDIRKYRYQDDSSLEYLQDEIVKQISDYIPHFQTVDVKIRGLHSKVLYIDIILDGELLSFKSNEHTVTSITY